MKFGLWFLPAAVLGGLGTLLAAALPVPPSLPSVTAAQAPATPTELAAFPRAATPAVAAIPPEATPSQPPATPPQLAATPPQPPATPYVVPTAVPPAPVAARPKRVIASAPAATALRNPSPRHVARSPVRHLAKAAPDRHRQATRHPVEPRYGAVVPKPPGPYPGMPVREPTRLAMVPPPPYGMAPPYWRPPYPPYPPN